jgi:hypothetical protein
MPGQSGLFDIDDRLKRLSDLGDQLETFRSAWDFEVFRPESNAALSYTPSTVSLSCLGHSGFGNSGHCPFPFFARPFNPEILDAI